MPASSQGSYQKSIFSVSVFVGECNEAEMLKIFLSSFEFRQHKDWVTYEEFELYYEGLSICVEEDDDFANMVKNAWSV